jgi:5-methylcytosine-specific restriction endonuclease McrA
MTTLHVFRPDLSDPELLAAVQQAATDERAGTADLIALLADIDGRRLYVGEGFASLFTYCTQVLHLSEHAAYGRIEVARAAQRHPEILPFVHDGSLTLTTVGLLAPHLNETTAETLLAAARHKSKREVEQLVGERGRRSDASALRALPLTSTVDAPAPVAAGVPSTDDASHAPINKVVSDAGAQAGVSDDTTSILRQEPVCYRLHVTIPRESHDDLRRAQDLLRHAVPTGDPAVIVARALRVLVRQLERTRRATTDRPGAARGVAPGTRRVSAAVRRQVWTRDGGRCAFVGTQGRCTERGFLELHHIQPFARGGATTVPNLELRCRAHNIYEAEQIFGPWRVRDPRASYVATRSGPSVEPKPAGVPP